MPRSFRTSSSSTGPELLQFYYGRPKQAKKDIVISLPCFNRKMQRKTVVLKLVCFFGTEGITDGEEMKKYTIAGIGELLWDVLPDAEVIGGAPVNFAYHVTALGAKGLPITTIGPDARGKKALAELKKRGVDIGAISISDELVTGYLQGLALDDINEQANRVAAYVCSQQGGMPHLPDVF
jgi:hypothetical protein